MADDEITLMARARAQDQKAFEGNVFKLKFLVWALGITFTGLVTATIWVTTIRTDVTGLRKDVDTFSANVIANSKRLDSYEGAVKLKALSDATAIASVQAQVNAIQEGIKSREPLIKEHIEMWFMKEHGISNAQDYLSRHPERTAPPLNPMNSGDDHR